MTERSLRLVHRKRYRVWLLPPLKTVGRFEVMLFKLGKMEAFIGFNNKQLMKISKKMVDDGIVRFEERIS